MCNLNQITQIEFRIGAELLKPISPNWFLHHLIKLKFHHILHRIPLNTSLSVIVGNNHQRFSFGQNYEVTRPTADSLEEIQLKINIFSGDTEQKEKA